MAMRNISVMQKGERSFFYDEDLGKLVSLTCTDGSEISLDSVEELGELRTKDGVLLGYTYRNEGFWGKTGFISSGFTQVLSPKFRSVFVDSHLTDLSRPDLLMATQEDEDSDFLGLWYCRQVEDEDGNTELHLMELWALFQAEMERLSDGVEGIEPEDVFWQSVNTWPYKGLDRIRYFELGETMEGGFKCLYDPGDDGQLYFWYSDHEAIYAYRMYQEDGVLYFDGSRETGIPVLDVNMETCYNALSFAPRYEGLKFLGRMSKKAAEGACGNLREYPSGWGKRAEQLVDENVFYAVRKDMLWAVAKAVLNRGEISGMKLLTPYAFTDVNEAGFNNFWEASNVWDFRVEQFGKKGVFRCNLRGEGSYPLPCEYKEIKKGMSGGYTTTRFD